MNTVKKSLLINLSLSAVSLVCFFMLAEASVRLFWKEWRNPDYFFRPSEMLRNELIPNKKVALNYEGREYSIIINSAGLRNREITLNKGKTYRIIVLGDSITFGSFVNAEDTYPYKLESLLNLNLPVRRFEVINAGVSGYGTIQEFIFLKEKMIKYKPDLVIVGFCMNDVEDNAGFKPLNNLTFYARKSALYTFLNYYAGLLRAKSAIHHRGGTAYNVNNSSKKANLEFLNRGYSGYMTDAWGKTESALKQIYSLSKANNARTVILIFPYAEQLSENKKPDPQVILDDFAKENGIYIIDLWDRFKKEDMRNRLYLEDQNQAYSGIHLSPYGHGIVAQEIDNFLSSNLGIRGKGRGAK